MAQTEVMPADSSEASATTAKTDSVPVARDSVVISILTCSPGTEVYELYGHTAIRVQRLDAHEDWAFNYGVFNFHTPHFAWRFTLGQCDYMVAACPFRYFMQEYEERGSSVTEQVLNLTSEEAQRLFMLLALNMQPENRVYRYNFLTNNCTTKVRDKVEEAIRGEVVYLQDDRKWTYRQLLHEYTLDSPWAEVGDDMLLGASVDTVLTDRAAMFLPERLMKYCDKAMIYDVLGNRRPLVRETHVLAPLRPQAVQPGFPLSPLMCSLLFLVFCLAVFALEQWMRRMVWGWDILLMLAHGACGLLLTFLLFFSEHPSLDTNWQVWLFHPLPLFCIPWVVRCAIKRRFCLYHYINGAILTLFIVFIAWIPQDFCQIIVPLALALLTRPISYYLYYHRKRHE